MKLFYLENHVVEHTDNEPEDTVAKENDHCANKSLKAIGGVIISETYSGQRSECKVRVCDCLLSISWYVMIIVVVKEVVSLELVGLVLEGSLLVVIVVQITGYVPEHSYEVTGPKYEYDQLEESKPVYVVHLEIDFSLVDKYILFCIFVFL